MKIFTLLRNGFLIHFLFILCHAPIQGQDLKISYNYLTKKTVFTYKKKKSGITTQDTIIPKIRKGDKITIEINDINPYAYHVTIDDKDSSVAPITVTLGDIAKTVNSSPFSKLLPGGAGSLLSSLSDASSGLSRGGPLTTKAQRLNAKRQERLDSISQGHLARRLAVLDTQITRIRDEINEIIKFNDTIKCFNMAIDSAIRNPKWTKDSIKYRVDSLLFEILENPDFDSKSLKKRANENYNNLKTAYIKYKTYLSYYASKANTVTYALSKLDSDLISQIDSSNESIDFEVARRTAIYTIQSRLEDIVKDTSIVVSFLSKNDYLTIDSIIDLMILKEKDLKTKSFTLSKADILALKDYKNINVSIFYNDSTPQKSPTVVEIKRFSLMAGHPLYTLGVVGVTFSRMFQQQYTYQNKSSQIVATKADVITPSIAAQLTLATPSPKKYLGYGGTLGLGLSLIDESLDFMLGPSLLIGGRQKLVITIGVIGGQVTKLSGNAKVGDALDAPDAAVPTNKIFTVGYFLGLSYSPKF